jgi:hypothetical protein
MMTMHDSKVWDNGHGKIYMGNKHSGNNQKFYVQCMDSSCAYMKFMGSGAGCLDYDFGGNKLYMGTCHSGANQIFYFEKNHGLMSGKGRYNAARIRCKQDYSKCLDYNPGNGDLYFGTCHTGTNQLFYFDM